MDRDYELRDLEFESTRIGLRVRLDAPQAANWLREDPRSMIEPHLVTEDPQIRLLMECMHREISSGCPSGALFAESVSLALITYFLGRYAAAAPGRLPNGLSTPKVRKIREYVEQNLARNIKLDELANLADLSAGHLCRSFKEATGTTPYRYVLQQRIARAKILLLTGKLSVTEIALLLGFSSHSHFSNCFRKEVGVSPRAFTRQ